MSEDKLIYKIDWHHGIEKMSGKEGTYIIRKRNGLIAAFIETQGKNITSFTPHQNRRLPRRIINKVAQYIIHAGFILSKDTARAMGVSIIKSEKDAVTYVCSSELKKRGIGYFLHKNEIEQISIYNLYKQEIKIPADSQGKLFDLQQANIEKLKVGENVHAEIDLRGNAIIEEVKIDDNFNGKIYLAQSNIRKLELSDNCHGEITYNLGLNRLEINIGKGFSGDIALKSAYLKRMNIGNGCMAHIRIELCIFYEEISIDKESTSEIVCSSVFARYFELGDYFSGKLEGLSQSSKQGVRELYIGNNFSGEVELNGSNTIERVELGADSDGKIDLVGCKSIRIVRIGENFSGELNLAESDIVYVRAETPCYGEFYFAEAEKLARAILPEKQGYIIKGIPRKPIKIQRKNGLVEYCFRRIKLPRGYFISTKPTSIWKKIKKKLF